MECFVFSWLHLIRNVRPQADRGSIELMALQSLGYIGIRASDVDESVKVIRVDGHLPEDKDYGLRLQPHAVK